MQNKKKFIIRLYQSLPFVSGKFARYACQFVLHSPFMEILAIRKLTVGH